MKKVLILAVLILVGTLGLAGVARADGMQIVCTGTTVCNPGGVETTTNTDPSFKVQTTGNGIKSTGELWIAIVEPVSSGANFSGSPNTSMWAALGLSGGCCHKLGNTESNDSPFFTGSDNGFKVTLFDTHQTLGPKSTSGAITLPSGSYPAGTIFVAFTANGKSIIANTPFSESLLVTGSGGGGGGKVPEPASMLLLGLGLIGVPFLRRKK